MRFLVGPVESLGHPFYPPPGVLKEWRIGSHEVYGFNTRILTEQISFRLDPIDAVVLWDPMWLHAYNLQLVRDIARSYSVPLIGIFGDWFTGRTGHNQYGTDACIRAVHGIVTDRVFASHLRREPEITQPVEVVGELLTYGRLPTLAGDDKAVLAVPQTHPTAARETDVVMIGYPHPYGVVLRGYYMDVVQQICDRRDWRLDMAHGVEPGEMETRMLHSKVCWNVSLGTTLNCRVYEAFAAGCLLLTDAWNVDADVAAQAGAEMYANEQMLEYRLEWMLGEGHGSSPGVMPEHWWAKQVLGTQFAIRHSPDVTWRGLLDAAGRATEAVRHSQPSLRPSLLT